MTPFDQKRRAAAEIRDQASDRIAEIEAQADAIEKMVIDKATEYGCDPLALKLVQDHMTDFKADYRFDELRMLEQERDEAHEVSEQTYGEYSRKVWESRA